MGVDHAGDVSGPEGFVPAPGLFGDEIQAMAAGAMRLYQLQARARRELNGRAGCGLPARCHHPGRQQHGSESCHPFHAISLSLRRLPAAHSRAGISPPAACAVAAGAAIRLRA